MPIIRNEFNKTIIRLKLLRDELNEKGLTDTAEALSEVVLFLDKADNIYIQELAEKRMISNDKTKK